MTGHHQAATAGAARGGRLTSFDSPAGQREVDAVLRVLLVEDNAADAELLELMLREDRRAGFAVTRAARLADARAIVVGQRPDVTLLDLSLPDGAGLDSVRAIQAADPTLPIVVMTGLADDELALRAVHEGAQDYLVKGRDDAAAVRRAVRYAVERQHLVLAARRAAAARDELLAVVSHDLRNPLNAVRMCAQALQDPAPLPPESARSMGDIIERSCAWMQRLIGDLLDVARIEAGTLRLHREPGAAATVVATLRGLYAPLAADRGLTLATTVAPDLPPLHADTDRLVQALGNLLDNALKFTPTGGRVAVTVRRVGAARDDAEAVAFEITDTGCGIAADHLAHVFDRFWQATDARRAGAGLGLAIARGIVEAHGGRIAVESTEARGTTFTCTIPASS